MRSPAPENLGNWEKHGCSTSHIGFYLHSDSFSPLVAHSLIFLWQWCCIYRIFGFYFFFFNESSVHPTTARTKAENELHNLVQWTVHYEESATPLLCDPGQVCPSLLPFHWVNRCQRGDSLCTNLTRESCWGSEITETFALVSSSWKDRSTESKTSGLSCE